MNILKILLVDDHEIFLKGLTLMLNEFNEFKVVGEASNGQEFLQKLDHIMPDVVLMDIKMPVLNGVEATKKAIEKYPDLKIIALTMFGEHKYLRMMADAGAHGFIQKNINKNELEQAIITVANGQTYFSPEMMADLAEWDTTNESGIFLNDVNERLSERELDVLKLIIKGLSSQEMANKLFISPRTVEGHRANLIAKTGTRNVVDLVIYAIRNHLVEI